LVEIDKKSVYYDGKQFSWHEISEIKRARSDRYLLVHNLEGKKLAKWDLNKIRDEELFTVLVAEGGKKIS
jgi:hypothetical protein